MQKIETVTRTLNFATVGEVISRLRCRLEGFPEPWGEPVFSDSHRWVIAEMEVEFSPSSARITRSMFRCLTCGEIVREQRPYRNGDEHGDYPPETVVNWDGSPAALYKPTPKEET